MDINFVCNHCSQEISVDETSAGQKGPCPWCGEPVTVPSFFPSEKESTAETISCPECGHPNVANNFKCTKCDFILHDEAKFRSDISDGSPLEIFIPYKNTRALSAYYLGVFSLIPCLGIFLGIPALILGINGMKYADRHPEGRGKGHARTGFIMGGISTIYNTLLVIAAMGSFD